MGFDTPSDLLKRFETVCERTPWLLLGRCRTCGESWYIAVDTVDDDYYFHRLSAEATRRVEHEGTWPTDFDSMENCWPLDREGSEEAP